MWATLFTDEQERARLSSLSSVLIHDRVIADSGAYSRFLLARAEVTGSAIGTTGYCPGGRMSLIARAGSAARSPRRRRSTAAGWLSPATLRALTFRQAASPPRSMWPARRTTTRSPPARPGYRNARSLTPELTTPWSSALPATDSRCPTTRLTTPKRTPGTGKHSASSTGPTSKAPEAHAKPPAQADVTQRARHGGWSRAHIAADMASRADRDLDCAGLTELVVMFAASGA
jgi:hypothetical protein